MTLGSRKSGRGSDNVGINEAKHVRKAVNIKCGTYKVCISRFEIGQVSQIQTYEQ
jgi:hypothetical protein